MTTARRILALIGELAFDQRDAKYKLHALAYEISKHLVKIVGMPTHPSVNHWKTEANGWRLDLIRHNKAKKKSGKNYTVEQLWQELWEKPFGDEGDLDLEIAILQSEGYPITKVDERNLRELVEKFIESIDSLQPQFRF